jgi:hypothetical protein
MKNETLYNKTVDILVQAYFNNTLEHSNCFRCAVGNLVAAANGYSTVPHVNSWVQWPAIHLMSSDGDQSKSKYHNEEEGLRQLRSTGYTEFETAKIEWAFEMASQKGDYMFNGLMAVVDVLDKIHEVNANQTEATKKRFLKVECQN